jgi:predicted DNA-binding protein YlxM (UPF0122 family)
MKKTTEKWCSKCFKTTTHKWAGNLCVCSACVKPEIKLVKKPAPRNRQYGNFKLTEDQVEEILLKRANGGHVEELAKEYNVSTQTIWDRTRNYNLITISKSILMKWIDERVEEKLRILQVK